MGADYGGSEPGEGLHSGKGREGEVKEDGGRQADVEQLAATDDERCCSGRGLGWTARRSPVVSTVGSTSMLRTSLHKRARGLRTKRRRQARVGVSSNGLTSGPALSDLAVAARAHLGLRIAAVREGRKAMCNPAWLARGCLGARPQQSRAHPPPKRVACDVLCLLSTRPLAFGSP